MIQTPATHRRPSADSDDVYPPGSRRFLGADFILVILFLGIVFYFLIPQAYEKQETMVPLDVVEEAFVLLQHAESLWQKALQEQGNSEEAWIHFPRLLSGEVEPVTSTVSEKGQQSLSAGILLLDNWGKHSYPNEELPRGWSPALEQIAARKTGILTIVHDGEVVLFLFKQLSPQGILVIAKPYLPLLRINGDA
jgi:hypothetical protein